MQFQPTSVKSDPTDQARIETQWLGRISYRQALELQEQRHAGVLAGEQAEAVYLLEHEPVITIGRTRDQSSLGNTEALPYPLFQVNRGGQATYHGPGQLVGYPILNLKKRRPDLHVYLRTLEEFLIKLLAEYGITGSRKEDLTGVWVNDRKIASLGVGVRKWVTMHGFALNIHGPLDGFNAITPCGISNVSMTSIEQETGCSDSIENVAQMAAAKIPELLLSLTSDNPSR